MSLLYAFLFGGIISFIAQVIYDNTKFSAGHITSLFVSFGAILEFFNLYDYIIKLAGVGASLPILSFGHSLMHASLLGVKEERIIDNLNVFDFELSKEVLNELAKTE